MRIHTQLRRIGEVLWYAYIMLPYTVQRWIAVFTLNQPQQAELFGTVFPVIGVWEIMAVAYLGLTVMHRLRSTIRHYTFLQVFVIINVISLLLSLCLYSINIIDTFYPDWIVEMVRLLLAIAVLITAAGNPRRLLLITQNGLFFLILPSILLYIFQIPFRSFYEGTATGRYHAFGLEVTSSGYMSVALVCTALGIDDKRRKWPALIIGVFGVLLSGSRNATIILVFCLLFLVIVHRKQLIRRLPGWATALGLAGMIFMLGGVTIALRTPTMSRLLEMGDSASETSTAIIGDSAVLGRFVAWDSGITVIRNHPLGLGNSDWAVQAALVSETVTPSHTHNTFMQTWLRLGPLALLIWIVLIHILLRGIRIGEPMVVILVLVLACWSVDYILSITKSTVVFLALISVCQARLVRHRTHT